MTTNSDNLNIGALAGFGLEFFKGYIDNVKIFNTSLSVAEIAWEYNQGAPVGHWRLDEKDGITAYDESDHDNDGTLTTMDPATDWINGKFNNGLSFDGSNDYVDLGDSSILQPDTLTVSLWFKTSADTATTQRLIRKRLHGYFIHLNSSEQIGGSVSEDSTHAASVGTTESYNDGIWHHVAMTYENGILELFVDGVSKGTDDAEGSGGGLYTEAGGIALGRDGNYSAYYFNGQMDEVKIYNYVLTSNQIQVDYNNGAAVGFR